MKERPEINACVKTKTGTSSPIYEGPVTSHGNDSTIFFQQVKKVDGEPQKLGTYPHPIICHVDDLID